MVKNENDKTAIIAFILNPPVEQRLIFGETGTGCQSQVIQGPTDQRTDRARTAHQLGNGGGEPSIRISLMGTGPWQAIARYTKKLKR
jgi:hypothetical protein